MNEEKLATKADLKEFYTRILPYLGGSGGGGGDSGLVYKQTLAAGVTTLTFTGLPLGGNSRVRFYSNPFILGLITDVVQTFNSITITCAEQESDVSIKLEIIAPKVLPNGKTITPTNDVSLLLACAGIDDKEYTTVTQLLSDSDTLEAVIQSNNAADYLKRSTDFATAFCNNSLAMEYIGENNYCANELISDSTWRSSISYSNYFESVLNTKIPVMTSNTTPSGVASASSATETNHPIWHAVNGGSSSFWAGGGSMPQWWQYDFGKTIKACRFKFNPLSYRSIITLSFIIQGSNDGENWTDLMTEAKSITTSSSVLYNGEYSANVDILLDNVGNEYIFRYIRFTQLSTTYGTNVNAGSLQIYGRA